MRIMIFGRSGSGKSTFALWLSEQMQLPLYHLDKYFFTENWVERDYDEFMADQQALVDQDHWIIDGNCLKSLEVRYQRADVAIYFNYPKLLCLWRIMKRVLCKDSKIYDRAKDCPEVVRWKFIKNMWNFEKRADRLISNLRTQYPKVKFYQVTRASELAELKLRILKLLN